jgi:hypothetical protein
VVLPLEDLVSSNSNNNNNSRQDLDLSDRPLHQLRTQERRSVEVRLSVPGDDHLFKSVQFIDLFEIQIVH